MIDSIPSMWHFQHNYGYHMHPTWYHMHTMWVSHAHHVSVTCHKGITSTPNVISWLTLFRPCDISNIIMGITCIPHGYQMHTTWVSHATKVSQVHQMSISWLTLFRPCDISNIIMGITCIPHGYHMHTTWVSHATKVSQYTKYHIMIDSIPSLWHFQHLLSFSMCSRICRIY